MPPVVRRLGVVSFFQDVASEMVYPLLPAFLALLGGGATLLGAMESIGEAAVAFVKGWAGRASDRWGRRKPFVLWGYGASALARPAMALAISAPQVVVVRIWDRIAKGLRSAPRDALIAAAVEPERHAAAFAYQRGLDHLGAAVGPLVAAGLLAAGLPLRWVFAAAILPALVGVAIVARAVYDDPPLAAATRVSQRLGADRGPLQRVLPAAFLFGLANASDAFLLLRAGDLGASPAELAFGWSGFHVVRWAASAPGGRLADRIGSGTALLLGWTLYAALYFGFGLATDLLTFVVLAVPYAAYAGLVEGSERAFAVERGGGIAAAGSSLGAWQRALGFGATGASLLFGLLWQELSARVAFSVAALLALVAVALLLRGQLGKSAQR